MLMDMKASRYNKSLQGFLLFLTDKYFVISSYGNTIPSFLVQSRRSRSVLSSMPVKTKTTSTSTFHSLIQFRIKR